MSLYKNANKKVITTTTKTKEKKGGLNPGSPDLNSDSLTTEPCPPWDQTQPADASPRGDTGAAAQLSRPAVQSHKFPARM